MQLKKIFTAIAFVGAAVPAVWALRKQLNLRTVRSRLAQAKAAGRKVPHAGKPRKARRLARHLAKTMQVSAR